MTNEVNTFIRTVSVNMVEWNTKSSKLDSGEFVVNKYAYFQQK